MRVLIIDDDETILDFLAVCLRGGFPGVEVTPYQSERLGRPGPEFDWASYDLLLLDYNLGKGEDGVSWLEEFGRREGFPKTILITGVNDPRVVAAAVASGADGYLNKTHLTPEQLLGTVNDVMSAAVSEGVVDLAKPRPSAPEPAAPRPEESAAPVDANYRYRRVIGRGAMSTVYLAERTSDGLTVVVKVLERDLAKDPEYVARFRAEGALVAGIDSPYVVRIYDRGITNTYDYIVMEFFGRGDLKQFIDQGMTPREALNILHNIACGLKAIHDVHIVHRDLKPANIMIRGDGSVALSDFGIAKRLDNDLDLTEKGSILGTLHYMGPEQAKGEPAHPCFDIYSAGCVFHEMLTGKPPYDGRSMSALLFQHCYGPVPTLTDELAVCQPVLDGCMRKKTAERFQSAEQLLEAIEGIDA